MELEAAAIIRAAHSEAQVKLKSLFSFQVCLVNQNIGLLVY